MGEGNTSKQILKNTKITKKNATKEDYLLEKKIGCRGIHSSPHSPYIKPDYCKNCGAWVQVIDKDVCACCTRQLPKIFNNVWLAKVLRFGIKQHHNFLRDWSMFPGGISVKPLEKPYTYTQKIEHITRKRKFKNGICRKCKSKLKKHPDFKKINFYCPICDVQIEKRDIKVTEGFYKSEHDRIELEIFYRTTVYVIEAKYLALALEPIPEEDKLRIIKPKMKTKGFRIFIPDGEETDMKCQDCGHKMKFDNEDRIFCSKCNGNKIRDG